ncbi:MAG: exodeoxyribonuclease III [Gammaproteobacteria bacterium]|nr:exodeoxyribonuclease III [Gammaproteobacteria bacterium]NNC98481.1 exodeoxyribonuclease III [Gammaproteobacteria bacterium]NNM12953.1 exodeoxyribonuclease III [Gammaproteobacteria bacterium]
MRVMSINTNGIRAAARKGFFEWLPKVDPDVVCIQETKAQIDQLSDPIFHPEGYHCHYHDAEKKGYSGVAIYSKQKPRKVIHGLTHDPAWEEFNREGRVIEAQFDNLSVLSVYLPSGSSKEERQLAKFRFMDLFRPYLQSLKRKRREFIICGDWNIVHTERDIKNWKSNQKNSGCLPEERAWLTALFDEDGYVDSFRELEQEPHTYTWWSNRGQAYANNVGWRLDYQVLSPKLKGTVKRTEVYKDDRFSDHAPFIVDYEL